ncbi:MAG: hypothetical protein V4516_03025 [Pseudomonadota bacterium]
MRSKILAGVIALGVLGFVGAFVWVALRPPASLQTSASGSAPIASVTGTFSDGRLDAQIYAAGNQNVRLEVQFTPDAGETATVDIRPDVYVAMVGMNMGGFDPPLELVGAGAWRANFQVPMAGRWVASVGFGEEFAEVEFDAR